MVNEGIIKEALNAVYEKTGIMFSRENIIIVMTDEFRKNPFYNGYYAYGTKIYIRPSLFEIDEEKFRQIFQNIKDVYSMTEDEFIKIKISQSLSLIKEVIIHEIGHWVHELYFGSKGMHIGEAGGYARKNAKENFAVAFQQYVEETLPAHNKRYQKMHKILSVDIKNTHKWVRDHSA